MKLGISRPSPATVIATIALIASLTGSAYAALDKNSVGTRQLRAKAVTTGKIAKNAVNGSKVANGSLSGADINLAALGTVPEATAATRAGNANTVSGHAAACPAGTTLLRGVCFDSASNPPAPNLAAAADGCAARGGYLPTPMALYSVRASINLGTGTGTDRQFTDAYYGNTTGGGYSTVVISGTGAISEISVGSPAEYVCAYPLVR
ncbi:MAG TPA: hypothetical protein VN752_00735 [Solirubrobacterales bacterium]|nr:hypothetical protein [Solirubrobacterales bacterium]